MKRFVLLLILAAGMAAVPVRADHDPLLDTVIGIAADALGISDAKPVIHCVMKYGSGCPEKLAQAAKAQGQQAVKQLAPNDPLIGKAISLVKALQQKNLLGILEHGGSLALKIACPLILTGGGPVSEWICKNVSKFSEPALKTVLLAATNPSVENLLKAVTVIGDPKIACDLVPGFPGKDAVCGPLGDVIKFAKDTAKEAAKLGKEAGEFLLDTGEGLLQGGAAALEKLCEFATLCDDNNGKQYMSADSYYKYVLFPRIHDRVRGELVQFASWGASFDPVRKAECLLYYDYYAFSKSSFPAVQSIAQQMLARCENLVARLRTESDAVVMAMKAAPAAYVDAVVKPQIPYSVIESYDYGTGKMTEFVKFFTAACLPEMQGKYPIPKPTKTTETAWDAVCGEVATLTKSAYTQEMGKIGWTLASLKKVGCAPPPALKKPPGSGATSFKLECDNYAGYAQCLSALSAGDEKKHCVLNQKKADEQLAKKIAQQLGAKRCSATGSKVICTRPWKVDACKSALAGQQPAGIASGVTCNPPPTAAQVAFAALVKQSQDIVFALNGGVKKNTGMKTEQGDGLVLFIPAGSDNCKTTWDPLTITCKNPSALAGLKDAMPGTSLGQCASDPNKDGADKPCYGGPHSKAAADKALAQAGVEAAPEIATNAPNKKKAPRGFGTNLTQADSASAPARSSKPPAPNLIGSRKGSNDASPLGAATASRSAPPTAAASIAPIVPKPALAVVGVTTQIHANCQSPQPALTVAVSIRNSGGPLAAGKGTVYVKETGGANLSSAGIHLPAVGAGQTQIVNVPAMTLAPYSTLPGNHQLHVQLNPLIETGVPSFAKPATLHAFSINFPAGHCDSRTAPPTPTRSTPEPARPIRR